MNSMAQQAVPNGKGQKEFLAPQSSKASNFVVIQLSPVMFTGGLMAGLLSPGMSLALCDWWVQAGGSAGVARSYEGRQGCRRSQGGPPGNAGILAGLSLRP